jgi:hypothetical protein
MKTMRTLVCLMVVLATLSVKTYGHTYTGDYTNTINAYIASYMNNDSKQMSKILADGACLKLSRGESLIVQPKQVLVSFMHESGKIVQNCGAKYVVIAKSGALVIACVCFDYANATQRIYLTLERNADKDWKITQVCKMIEDKEVIQESKDLASNP